MPKYFDIHSHLNLPNYDADREEVVKKLEETDTYTIVVGVDLETSKQAVWLADKYKNIYACIGIHPVDNPTGGFDKDEFDKLVKNPKVVSIGECGMDFYHAEKAADYERQKKLFLDQVAFALEHDKPLMIHARNAYEEILEILEPMKSEKLRGDIHFFAGDLTLAKRFWNIGFTTSFTGVITFPPKADQPLADTFIEVIKNAPIEMLMSETDAPFATPEPYRGKRNEPSYVSEVVKKIAEIRGEDFEAVREALVTNAFNMIR